MKSKRLLVSLLTVSLTASLALAGCGKKAEEKTSEDGNGNSKEAKVDKDQYLNLLLQSEPKSLDPSKSTDSYSSQVLTNVMEALTRVETDKDGKKCNCTGSS